MKIKTIKRTKTRSIVSVNDEYWGSLPNKILHFYCKGPLEEFKLNKEESEKLLDEIKKLSWNKLLDYLAYRERSYHECKVYLSQKLFLKKEIIPILLNIAKSKNYIDDARFAEMLTEELIRKAKSKTEIKNKLFSKRIDETIISEVIQKKIDTEINAEILDKNIKKAKNRFYNLTKKERDEKILNYLTRKGFAYWEVKEKLGE